MSFFARADSVVLSEESNSNWTLLREDPKTPHEYRIGIEAIIV